MINFQNVTKVYDNGTKALQDINIRIEDGEFVFVVGASGSGKSTFLKLMMRDEVPSHGDILVDGINLNGLSRKEVPFYRRRLGIVFQDFRLIPNMTVYDNIAFAMRVVGTREKEIDQRVPHVISLVGLEPKARCLPVELSGGEQQRVALARALANDADILIADEPTGNVDPQMSFEIVELLTELNRQGTTVIMVTHEHNLVKQFNRRVVILDKGRVVSDGMPYLGDLSEPVTPKTVYQKPAAQPMPAVQPKSAAKPVAFPAPAKAPEKVQPPVAQAAAEPQEADPDILDLSFLERDDGSVFDFSIYLEDDWLDKVLSSDSPAGGHAG